MNISTSVGGIILNQIKQLDRWALGAWGAFNPNQPMVLLENGLQFFVNGSKHKGKIIITLEADDTYTITAGHLKDRIYWVVDKVVDQVYCDMLVEVIDDIVG